MGRFYDIIWLLTLIQAAIGLLNASCVFNENFMENPEAGPAGYELSDLSQLQDTTNIGMLDYFIMAVKWAISGAWFMCNLLLSVVYVYPLLVDILGVNGAIAAFLQVGVVVVYIAFFIQFLTKSPWGGYDT